MPPFAPSPRRESAPPFVLENARKPCLLRVSVRSSRPAALGEPGLPGQSGPRTFMKTRQRAWSEGSPRNASNLKSVVARTEFLRALLQRRVWRTEGELEYRWGLALVVIRDRYGRFARRVDVRLEVPPTAGGGAIVEGGVRGEAGTQRRGARGGKQEAMKPGIRRPFLAFWSPAEISPSSTSAPLRFLKLPGRGSRGVAAVQRRCTAST